MKKYENPDLIVFDNALYDFGYYSLTEGTCVIYIHGEKNMQDSGAVPLNKIRLATDEDKQKLYYGR